jgi:tRNA(Ile2) C34 agmatinyltransferase TiaS
MGKIKELAENRKCPECGGTMQPDGSVMRCINCAYAKGLNG